MRPFTPGELARLHQHSDDVMLDTGIVESIVPGVRDSRGRPADVVERSTTTRCQFVPTSADEAQPGGAQAPLADAVVSLPYGVAVKAQDRFRLTHRFGQQLATPLVFRVIGQPMPGISSIEVRLRAGEGL